MGFGFLVGPRRVLGKLLIAAGFLLLYLLSISPVSDALLGPIEAVFPPWKDGLIKADTIVVLGGGVRDLTWLAQPCEASDSSKEHVVTGITIYRKHHLPLVFMGGNGDPSGTTVCLDAEAMARTALELGVPARDVRVENKSRNTLESAKALKGLIKGNSIILVTSAFHLKRASAMFIKQGFRVIPAPAGYRCEHRKLTFFSFIPHAGNLSDSSTAIYEYMSLFWYSVNGAI
ncbi:MAG TPA: ElyC/SanA/YdcF family protein [Nitrospirota bacterium]|nr:ElyC/SanA/YdcF family protein [Nitrospirota bacterium]